MESKEFEARFPGVCAGCGEGVEVGDLVWYVDGEVEHVECVPVLEAGETCPECFTVVAKSGDCLCIY